jgi:glucose-1-phosphatase
MIKTIFFDFGNVLCFFDHQISIQKLSSYTHLEPKVLTTKLYGGVLEELYEIGQITTEDYFREAKKEGSLTCTEEVFRTAFTQIFTPNLPVHQIIPRLKKQYRLVLASNTNDAHYTSYREEFRNLLQYFDFLCVSHEARARKPHSSFFAYCQRFAHSEPSECLFIDDLELNVHAAQQFGWNGIVYRNPVDLIHQLREMGLQLDYDEEGIVS